MAAVGCADGTCDPPPELVLYWECQTFHALPEPGGLLDQPAGLVGKMRACANAYELWQAWKAVSPKEAGKFIKANKKRWETIQKIMEWQTDG